MFRYLEFQIGFFLRQSRVTIMTSNYSTLNRDSVAMAGETSYSIHSTDGSAPRSRTMAKLVHVACWISFDLDGS